MTTTDRHEIDFDHHSSEFRDQCRRAVAVAAKVAPAEAG